MEQTTTKSGSKYSAALRTATRLLVAKQIKDKRTKSLCRCRVVIGDNKACELHGSHDG